METDTNLLLERAAQGDQQSFKLLYDAIAPRILAFLMKMLTDRHLAEDVLQETMIQSWRKAAQFDPEKSRATTWIVAIARNRALDHLRKTGRFNQLLGENDFQIREALYQQLDGDGRELESSRTQRRLRFCFEELGEDTAACIRLAYIRGLSLREIADYRDDSLGTVKSWVRRGLQKLGECMQR